jgi:hypothetical protein
MQSGPIVRKRKSEKAYKKYVAAKEAGCDFCDITPESHQFKQEHTYFWIIENIFGYDMWDGVDVLDHLLCVPKRHVDGMHHFTEAEAKEYFTIMASYEENAYSVYARAPQNIVKSVPHQHTHFIRIGTKRIRSLLYLHKPHWLIYR